MRTRRRGQPVRIALGGALACALALASPAGAEEPAGPNVVATAHPAGPRVNKITTLLNAISSMPGRDRTRDKYINEIIATAARAAADGHTAANADEWKTLDDHRRRFVIRRRQEAVGGTETDKKRFEQDKTMWCRLRMLTAAAHVVDGGDPGILQAVNILEQVLVEAREIKNPGDRSDIEDRVKALGSAALLLKPGPPPAADVHRHFTGGKDPSGLRGTVQGLYAGTDPNAAVALVARTRQALQGLAPARGAAPARKPNRFRDEAEGVVAGAVDSFLESVTLIKDYQILQGDQLSRAEESARRYRIPPSVEVAYRTALTGKHQQLEIHDAFKQWTADPYRQEKRTARALKAMTAEQFPTLRYYQAVFDAWRTDKLYRRDNLDESRHTYGQLLGIYRAELDRARRETPAVVAGGSSRLEQYVKALLDQYGRPCRVEGMGALGKSEWDDKAPLQRALRRAVQYHLLRRQLGAPAGGTDAWRKRLEVAAELCRQLQQDGQAPDAGCLSVYQQLYKQVKAELDKLVQAAQAKRLEQVGQMVQAGRVAEAVAMSIGPESGSFPPEALLLVFRAAVRGETVRDAARRTDLYRLGAALLSRRLRPERRREADALYDELCVWDEHYRIEADSAPARRRGAAAIRAVLSGSVAANDPDQQRYARIRRVAEEPSPPGRWDPRAGPPARRIWLEGLIDAEAYAHATTFLAARTSQLDLRKLAAGGRELPDRLTRMIGQLIESPKTPAELASWLPRARSLLGRSDLPLAPTVSGPLKRRLGQRYETLHAIEIAGAPSGGAFAAYRARAAEIPAGASLDSQGRVLWQEALARLVREADAPRDFRDLAGLRIVTVPHERLARRAMDKALDAAGSGRIRAAGELADAAAVLLAPVGARVQQADYWFDRYISLADNPRFTVEQRRRWKRQAGRYLPDEGGTAWDLYRRATLAYEVDDLPRCRRIIEAIARVDGRCAPDMLVLGAACIWRQAWPSAKDAAALSQAVAAWWQKRKPGDPYESLMGLKGLRAGTAARRDLAAALVYLGRADSDVRQLRALLEACARAARGASPPAQGFTSRPFDRLVWDEPALAGYVHGLVQIRLAEAQTGVLRRNGMTAAVQRFLPDGSASRWADLPPALQQAVADAVYEGHCWTRGSAVYGIQMRALRDEVAAASRPLAPAEVEACRRWLECEVYRRAGADVSLPNLVRHLRAAAGELAWTDGCVFTGLVSPARRSAAAKIWSGSDGQTNAIDDLYSQMIRRTANKCLKRSDQRFDNTRWGPLRHNPRVNPYASLWCFVSVWPQSSRFPKQWAYAGPGWPKALQDWVEGSEGQDAASAAERFNRALEQWQGRAGPAGRDRRAEALLVRHLLYKDGGSLADAVRTFAFGNPEYSLAVRLAEEK